MRLGQPIPLRRAQPRLGQTDTVVGLARELRKGAVNQVSPLWTQLRDTINRVCMTGIHEDVSTDAQIASIPGWCYYAEDEVQVALKAYVGAAGLWISMANRFLHKFGDELQEDDPGELARIGEEFDQIVERRGLILDMTLDDPDRVFLTSVIPEFINWWDDLYRAIESVGEAARAVIEAIPEVPRGFTIAIIAGVVLLGGVALAEALTP